MNESFRSRSRSTSSDAPAPTSMMAESRSGTASEIHSSERAGSSWYQLTSVLAFLVAISYVHRAPAALFGLDQINTMLSLYLAIGYLTLRPADNRARQI
jgi:hypothetical protein